MDRPRLLELQLAVDPARWAAAGFATDDEGRCRVGRTDLVLGAGGSADAGIVGWTLEGAIPADDGIDGLATRVGHAPEGAIPADDGIDGLATRVGHAPEGAAPADDGIDGLATRVGHAAEGAAAAGPPAVQPNGAVAIDHVVVMTPDLPRTLEAFDAAGLELRRVRDAGTPDRPLRQGFLLLADALVEVVGPPEPAGDDPARFWGLTLVVEDLDATAARLGDALGPIREAVQPGRRIATFRREAGLGLPVALMTPRR